jgi:mannose-6-phosphate isomerase-like protein (cupin superfamily)
VGDFVLRHWHLEPRDGDQAPPHVHDASDEGFCVLRGELEVLVGENRRVLRAGESVVIPAGAVHTFATVGPEPVAVLAVMTPEVDALVRELHEPHNGPVVDLWSTYRSRLA